MKESKLRHLDYLQNNIARMNQCSSNMKGWFITIVLALMTLQGTGLVSLRENSLFIVLVIAISLVFWLMDAYYLTKERDFITVYNTVTGVIELPLEIKPFEICPSLGKYKTNYWKVAFSKTEAGVYIPIAIFASCFQMIIKVVG